MGELSEELPRRSFVHCRPGMGQERVELRSQSHETVLHVSRGVTPASSTTSKGSSETTKRGGVGMRTIDACVPTFSESASPGPGFASREQAAAAREAQTLAGGVLSRAVRCFTQWPHTSARRTDFAQINIDRCVFETLRCTVLRSFYPRFDLALGVPSPGGVTDQETCSNSALNLQDRGVAPRVISLTPPSPATHWARARTRTRASHVKVVNPYK